MGLAGAIDYDMSVDVKMFPEVWIVAVLMILAGTALAARWRQTGTVWQNVSVSLAGLAALFAAWRVYEIGDKWPWTVAAMQFTIAVPMNLLLAIGPASYLFEKKRGVKLDRLGPKIAIAWTSVMWMSIAVLLPVVVALRLLAQNRMWNIGVLLLFLPALLIANRAALITFRDAFRSGNLM